MKTLITTIAMLTYALACSNGDTPIAEMPSAKAEPSEPATPNGKAEEALQAPPASTDTPQLCRQLMQRQRACSSTFIPALVAARVERDDPSGIAAVDARDGREALVEKAFGEWKDDSKDAAIDTRCDSFSKAVNPAREDELRSSLNACLQIESCAEFVPCAVPVNLGHWKE